MRDYNCFMLFFSTVCYFVVSARRCPVQAPAETGGLSVRSLHALSVSAWVYAGYSGFNPQPKDMQVR